METLGRITDLSGAGQAKAMRAPTYLAVRQSHVLLADDVRSHWTFDGAVPDEGLIARRSM